MVKWKMVIIVTFILCLIVIAVIVVVFSENLIEPDLPLPEGKARFLRYLSCSYAMCAKGCDSSEVINIWLDEKKGGCNDVCNELKSNEDCSEDNGHLCGSGCYLEFEFNLGVKYRSDYEEEVWRLGMYDPSCFRVDTDVTRYPNVGYEKILEGTDGKCFGNPGFRINLDDHLTDANCGHDVGICGPNNKGFCEGMLRMSEGCKKGSSGDPATATGHIWIDPAIADQCEPYEYECAGAGCVLPPGYYKNCEFDAGQKIYIWVEHDLYEGGFIGGKHYCPELIICSNPP